MGACLCVCVCVCLCVSDSEKGGESGVFEAYYRDADKRVSASFTALRFVAGVVWPKLRDNPPPQTLMDSSSNKQSLKKGNGRPVIRAVGTVVVVTCCQLQVAACLNLSLPCVWCVCEPMNVKNIVPKKACPSVI